MHSPTAEEKFSAPVEIEKVVEQKKSPTPVIKNKIHAKAKSFLNGKALKDWSLYSVHVVNVKKQDWENFFDRLIEFRVKDFPAEILRNSQAKVTCKNNLDAEFYVEKIFEGQSVGEELLFKIPLNQFIKSIQNFFLEVFGMKKFLSAMLFALIIFVGSQEKISAEEEYYVGTFKDGHAAYMVLSTRTLENPRNLDFKGAVRAVKGNNSFLI